MWTRARRCRARGWGVPGYVALVVLGVSCGLGDREALEARITAAPGLAAEQRTARLLLTQTVDVELPNRGPDAPAIERPELPPVTVEVLVDFAAERAAVVEVPAEGAPAEVAQIFDGLAFYQRKATPSGQDIGRPWLKLDYHRLDTEVASLDRLDGAPAAVLNAVNPAHLFEFLRGTLTGSIDRVGTEDVNGVTTTHYEVNVARDKAFGGDWDDDDVEALDGALASMRVPTSQVVLAGHVWLDPSGLPRRAALTFKERYPARTTVELTVTIEVLEYGTGFSLDPPAAGEVVEVTGFGALAAALGEGTTP